MMIPREMNKMGKRPRVMRMRFPRNIPMTMKVTELMTSSRVSRASNRLLTL